MTTCPRCNQPIDPTQPTATMTYMGKPYSGLHVQCGFAWQSVARDHRDWNVGVVDMWNGEVRSLRIVPAQETADDDGLRVVDGVCVGGWAH